MVKFERRQKSDIFTDRCRLKIAVCIITAVEKAKVIKWISTS